MKEYKKTLLVVDIDIIRLKSIGNNDNTVILIFKNILYILESDFNLIFIRILRKDNYSIKFILNDIKVDRYKLKAI